MKMKKTLAIILALSMILTLFGTTTVFADTQAPNAVYASQSGGGDGSSAGTPTTLADAMSKVSNGGTVYVVGKIGNSANGINEIKNTTGKSINFCGVDSNSAFISKIAFDFYGDVSFSNIAFEVADANWSGEYALRRMSADCKVTFGENVTTPNWTNYGWFTPGDNNTKSTISISSGNFSRIFAGGHNNSQTVEADITVNGGNVGTLAVAHGYHTNPWTTGNEKSFSGTKNFTVNGGTVNQIILGCDQSAQNTIKGVVKATVNGGTVNTLSILSHREINSNGLRIAEINGGTVTTVKKIENSVPTGTTQTVLILNNGMASSVNVAYTPTSNDTVIRVETGGALTAKVSGNSLLGYEIDTDKAVLVDGVQVLPDTNGLYSIGSGEHTVTFGEVIVNPEVVYASADGSGNGFSAAAPTTFTAAQSLVKDGGTIYIVGQIDVTNSSNFGQVGVDNKEINYVGYSDDAVLYTGACFQLFGAVSFKNIEFKVGRKYDFSFKIENSLGCNVTFLENVKFPTNDANWTGVFPIFNDKNKNSGKNHSLTISGGQSIKELFALGYQSNIAGTQTDIVLNDGNIATLAAFRGWYNDGKARVYSGTCNFTVNGGTVGNLILGHSNAQANQYNGAAIATINGGTVTTVLANANNKDLNSTGLRIIEINGGNVGTVKVGATAPTNSNLYRVVILNNGVSVGSINEASFESVIKAPQGISVSPVCADANNILGYTIDAGNNVVTLDGEVIVPDSATGLYTIPRGIHQIGVATEENYEGNVKRTVWINRAEALINTENAEFVAGLDALKNAVTVLKYSSNNADDDALIASLRTAWNSVKYTIGGETVTEKLFAFGDVNGDEACNILDLVGAKKNVADSKNEVEKFTLDINSDGENTSADLVLLRKLILGVQ